MLKASNMQILFRILRKIKCTAPLMLLTILFLTGQGCQTEVSDAPKQFPAPVNHGVETSEEVAQPLTDFMDRRSVTYRDGRTVTFLVVKVDEEEFTWGLANDPQNPKTVLSWREGLDASLVINGSYFDEEMRPTGYYSEAGIASSRVAWPSRDSQANKAGYTGLVQIIDGELKLSYLPQDWQKEAAPDVASFLSFPTLLNDGEVIIKEDSQKYAHRTVLAQDQRGVPYIIITETGIPSLYETAVWLSEQPEEFEIAINLDGGPSTGLSYKDTETSLEINSAVVPNVVYLKKQ